VVKKKKSAKRQAAGRRLAATLPRDERGKFLPRGSTNRFNKKKRRKGKEPAEGPVRRRRQFRGREI